MRRKIKGTATLITAVICGITITACNVGQAEPAANQQEKTSQQTWTKESAKKHVKDWPNTAKESATTMIDKYGVPEEVTNHRLIWHNKENWKEIIVYKEEVDHDFPMPHKDVLEQFVSYDFPVEKYSEIAKYDGSVIIERTKGVVSARCDKEPANILALNLANDIAQGKRSVEDARSFYAQTVVALLKGEKPEYTQKLMFSPDKNAGDSDQPVIDKEVIKELMGQK